MEGVNKIDYGRNYKVEKTFDFTVIFIQVVQNISEVTPQLGIPQVATSYPSTNLLFCICTIL